MQLPKKQLQAVKHGKSKSAETMIYSLQQDTYPYNNLLLLLLALLAKAHTVCYGMVWQFVLDFYQSAHRRENSCATNTDWY